MGYDAFLAAMVELSQTSVFASRLRTQGHAERPNWRELPLPPAEDQRRRFASSLTAEQRDMIARLLLDERLGAVHGVLSWLEWAKTCEDLALRDGEEDFGQACRETFHGDFIAKLPEEG